MSLGERIRSLFRLFLLLTVLIAVALISAITTIRLTIHGHQETMPKLVGMPLESAQRMASGLGVELKVEDNLFSTQYPAHQVVSQIPPPGIPIKKGQRIHVILSLGPPKVNVPNLVGSTVRAAKISAIQRGLTLGDVAIVHWPESETDLVVAQEPPATTAVMRSPAVNLLVSLGNVPEAYLCPNFVGMPLVEARRTLEKGGLKVGQVTTVPSDQSRKGIILTQSPPPGSKVAADTVFDFQVAQ